VGDDAEQKVKIAHVLTMDIVGHAKLIVTQQTAVIAELTKVVLTLLLLLEDVARRLSGLFPVLRKSAKVLVVTDNTREPYYHRQDLVRLSQGLCRRGQDRVPLSRARYRHGQNLLRLSQGLCRPCPHSGTRE
jgi:hypothetical protein